MKKSKFRTIKHAFFKVYLPLLLVIMFLIFLYCVFNIHEEEIFEMILENETSYLSIILEFQKMNNKYSFFMYFFLFIWLLSLIRKENIDKFYNSNGNVYYDHKYCTFWIAAKIMGYGKIQLSGIPLWLQSKLILNNTFPKIEPDMWLDHYKENSSNDCNIEIIEPDEKCIKCYKSINVIIEDTYEIRNSKIGKEFENNPILKIQSKCDSKGPRIINKSLVEKVKSSLDKYSSREYDFENMFIFTTANPINNQNITVSCLRKFDRLSNMKIYIVQMDENMIYSKKRKIVG